MLILKCKIEYINFKIGSDIISKIKKYFKIFKVIFFSLFLIISVFFARRIETLNTKINQLNKEIVEYDEKYKFIKEKSDEISKDINKLNEIIEKETNWTIPKVELELCSTNKTFKSYMDYRKITNKLSKQYKIIQTLDKCSDGLLRDKEGYIAVALGSKYGDIGDRFIIRLSTGKEVKVIKADEKSDKDTINGCFHKSDGSMIEVIVQNGVFEKTYKLASIMGDFNYSDVFNGVIVKIYKIK